MRIQYLAVIFVIIVLPISLVISLYTGNLIKVSNTEAQYNRILFNATHDAVRTYQMNTLDNTYASEDTSKFRDVNASINSFYNNLGTGLSRSGYSKEELYDYVPAIMFNLYDGYYVYSPYQNVAIENGDDADVYGQGKNAYSKILLKRAAEKGIVANPDVDPKIDDTLSPQTGGVSVDGKFLNYYNESTVLTNEPEFGLQNYNYYACEYKGKTKSGGDYDIIINYTLDNYIRVYGTVDGTFYNYEGYYIYIDGISLGATGNWAVTGVDATGATLGSVQITPERLGEYVAYYDPYTVYYKKSGYGRTQRVIYQKKGHEGHEGINYFNYIVYNGVKYYLDTEHLEYDAGKIWGLKEAEILDYSLDGVDVNAGVDRPYTTNKYQYIRWYQDNGDGIKSVRQEYNTSFNNTYTGIPIFKTEGKQRIYISQKELCDIIDYLNGYHKDMLRDSNHGGDDAEIRNFFDNAKLDNYWQDLNDVYYYTNAYDFSRKVNDDVFKKIILDLNPGDADHPNNNYSVVSDAYNTKYTAYFEFDKDEGKSDHEDERYYLHEKYNYGDQSSYVFHSWDASGTTLDVVNPDLDTSLFNQHRIDVITSCIEYSFANAVENFNAYMESAYRYKVPDISEADWGRICNNISCLTMMQGMPIGNYKFYNNYSLVVDNKVNEYTPKSGIYVEDNYQVELGSTGRNIPNALRFTVDTTSIYQGVTYNTNRSIIFHNPGCSEYSEAVGTTRSVIGYRLIDYDIDSYSPPADLKGYLAYEGYEEEPPAGAYKLGQQIYFYLRPGTGCYNCVVSQNKLDFSIDDLLSFKTTVTLGTGDVHTISNNVRQAYMRALARERGAKARFSSDTTGKKVFGTYQS